MSHICYRCGATGSFNTGETALFRNYGFDIRQDFPFKPATAKVIRLCRTCREEVFRGRAMGSKPLYHPVNEALKNA